MDPKTADEPVPSFSDISEVRPVSEIQASLEQERLATSPGEAQLLAAAPERVYAAVDPLEGDALSASGRRRSQSEHPCAYDAIAFVEGPRVLTITWLPPAA